MRPEEQSVEVRLEADVWLELNLKHSMIISY
jgi:hypothetical protein